MKGRDEEVKLRRTHEMKNLTKRELEILQLTRDGLSNKSIATTLGISEQTVKNHLAPIFRKLNATSRTHAVVIALRSGYLTL